MTTRVRSTALLAGALAALALLAGCSAPSPAPSPTPTAAVTPTPTPTPAPTVAFDGDCGAVFADAAFSALTGRPMVQAPPGWSVDDARRLGGVDCLWRSDDAELPEYVTIQVFPIPSVPGSMRVPEATSTCPEVYYCLAAGESDGMWVSVGLSGGAPIKETSEQLRDAVLTKLQSRVVPIPSTDRSGWWSLPACTDLRVDDGWTPQEPYVEEGLVHPLVDLAGMNVRCGFLGAVSGETVETFVSFHPGGAPAIESAAAVASAREIAVEGATRAVVTMDPDPIEPLDERLVATDGTNLLIVKIPLHSTAEDFVPLTSSLLSAMAD